MCTCLLRENLTISPILVTAIVWFGIVVLLLFRVDGLFPENLFTSLSAGSQFLHIGSQLGGDLVPVHGGTARHRDQMAIRMKPDTEMANGLHAMKLKLRKTVGHLSNNVIAKSKPRPDMKYA